MLEGWRSQIEDDQQTTCGRWATLKSKRNNNKSGRNKTEPLEGSRELVSLPGAREQTGALADKSGRHANRGIAKTLLTLNLKTKREHKRQLDVAPVNNLDAN